MLFIYDDNFLTEEEVLDIEHMYWSRSNPWTFMHLTQDGYTTHPGVIELPGIDDIPYFTYCPNSEAGLPYDLSVRMINKFVDKHNIKYDSIGRIKFNLTPRKLETSTLYPHTDTMDPHYVFLFYVNDTDGDTVVYNETSDGHTKLTEATEWHRITPKRGAAFLVDGRHFHAIGTPSVGPLRGVINANLLLNQWPN